MDAGAWWAAAHGVAEGRTRLSDFTSTLHFLHWRRTWHPTPGFLPGEPQGRGAWWAAVSGVAQSRTRLSDLAARKQTEREAAGFREDAEAVRKPGLRPRA